MKQFKRNISSHLIEYRHKNHITQEEFAEKLGISVVFYGEIERQKKLPSTNLTIKIYREMGFDFIPISDSSNTTSSYTELLCIISTSPETADILLEIAKNLPKTSS